jgi:protein SCO1
MGKLFGGLVLACLAFTGCRSVAKPDLTDASGSSFKTYRLRGRVVQTNRATGEVTIAHEAIAGFMPAMTMPYRLKDPGIMSELHPGDVLTADLEVSEGAAGSADLDHIDIIAQAQPDYRPTVIYHVPARGDPVPDFKLRNQDGRPIHLSQFRGMALLVTFIYTRCPLPNFCPLVTRNFSEINRQLWSDRRLYGRTHLLCVSFDPDHDTPARLRAYAEQYMGGDQDWAFAHWDFAVPTKRELDAMARYFDVGLSAGPDDTITHTLSTTLIDPQGKVAGFYPGNEWTPQQIMAAVKDLMARTG